MCARIRQKARGLLSISRVDVITETQDRFLSGRLRKRQPRSGTDQVGRKAILAQKAGSTRLLVAPPEKKLPRHLGEVTKGAGASGWRGSSCQLLRLWSPFPWAPWRGRVLSGCGTLHNLAAFETAPQVQPLTTCGRLQQNNPANDNTGYRYPYTDGASGRVRDRETERAVLSIHRAANMEHLPCEN